MPVKSRGSNQLLMAHDVFDPVDATPYYFSNSAGRPPGSLAAYNKTYFNRNCTITAARFSFVPLTAVGTAENISLSVRKNDTTDYLIETIGSTDAERIFHNEALNIPIVVGDFIEIKYTMPTWATNPTGCKCQGWIYLVY